MVDLHTALSWALVIFGSFIFIMIKLTMGMIFKGKKGWLIWVIKFVIALACAVGAGITWDFCPSMSIILVFAALIISGLIGFGVMYFSQYISFVGNTSAYAFSLMSGFITIWLIIAIIEFITLFLINVVIPIAEIVIAFTGVGLAIDVLVSVVQIIASIIYPIIFSIIQFAVAWALFSATWSGVAGCILGMGRMAPIPGTGGIMIGALK